MEILLAGIEYSGTTTLGEAISAWYTEQTGRQYGFHDHFKYPQISHAVLDSEQQQTVLDLSPRLKEQLESHQVDYHVQSTFFHDGNHAVTGMHLDEAVYGPLYWGYGGPGEPGDRSLLSQKAEDYILKYETSMVLVLLKSEPEVIARRMKENPHENSPLREEDIPLVLQRFEEFPASPHNREVHERSNSLALLPPALRRRDPLPVRRSGRTHAALAGIIAQLQAAA